jgi:hypothetical protein
VRTGTVAVCKHPGEEVMTLMSGKAAEP